MSVTAGTLSLLGDHGLQQAAAPTGETKVVHDYSLPFDTATLTLEEAL